MYEVTILNQPKDKIIPHRNEDKTLDWDYNKVFTCWSDSISLKLLTR